MTSLARWYLSVIFLALFLRSAVGQSATEAQVNGAKNAGSCAIAASFTSTMPPEVASEFSFRGRTSQLLRRMTSKVSGRMQPVLRLKHFPLSR